MSDRRGRRPSPARRVVAAFDVDGTLTRRDTLVPFLVRVAGPRRVAAVAGRVGLSDPASLRDRDATKERLLARLFAGLDEAHVRSLGRQHARDVLADGLRPEVLDRLHRHRHAGHEIVFVSASLVYYLEPIAEELGVDAVIAVEPEAVDGRLTGALVRPNVRAAQKAVRLREWLGAPPSGPLGGVELWAYGNSSGDHQLLELADHAEWLGDPRRRPGGVQQFPGPAPD